MKMSVKLKADYNAVLHMPVLKEGKDRVSLLAGSMLGNQSYTQPGEDEASTAFYPQWIMEKSMHTFIFLTPEFPVFKIP